MNDEEFRAPRGAASLRHETRRHTGGSFSTITATASRPEPLRCCREEDR
jgi:hypothetical protein